ncbi:MAG: hypothetical protein JWM68_4765 [Verrucomicrobiales bacterium]|nr:hypothetical protein [Verrucomicrobiales bacterium]
MTIQRGLSLSLAIAVSVLLGGCVTGSNSQQLQEQSPLQIRARETRTYEDRDAKTTLKTVLDVLQDEGYLVDYGNTDLGLLHASKTTFDTVDQSWFWQNPLTTRLEATVNVSSFGGQMRVRINFQTKVSDSQGNVYWTALISDPKFYQEFFAKLDRGLFIQKQGL